MTRRTHFCLLALALSVGCGDDSTMTPDASMEDVGTDGGPECRSDRECDDGLFCNGAETCSDGGACVPGEEVLCDDGVACTFDLCDDELDRCVFAPPDEDGDGSGDAACVDGEGNPLGADCDDTDPLTFPGNPEVCDLEGHDEDCDPTTFGRRDVDGDGFFDAVCCNGDVCGTDCDDLRANANPATTEVCDAIDNDCDDTVDEGVRVAGFVDADRDGFGDHDMPLEACAGRAGFVAEGGPDDCDDTDLNVNPGQLEICDGRDNDCDPATDDDDAVPVEWYADLDGDGFGSRASGITISCVPPEGHSLRDTDCDDDDAGRHPAAAEMCNGIDDDCNGVADFEIAPGDFEDDDGDGLVDVACGALGTDCDDRDASAGPGTAESCDGRDNDCDERVDEGAEDRSWFADVDGDGFGTDGDPENPTIRSCVPPPGYVGNADDCADRDAARRPGASEACNTRDDDCDGAVDEGGVCGCPPGFADCDDDGSCETDTRSDPANCGSCGDVCVDTASGVATVECRSSMCRIATCDEGRADCDGLRTNGCEIDLRTDDFHCGACDRGCSFFPGSGVSDSACEGGRCVVANCEAGRGDCNARFSDGCETDTSTDVFHCGTCGNACTETAGEPMCMAGTCVSSCIEGETADCDADASNGCETAIDTRENCGGCGIACPAPGPGTFSECVRDVGGPRCDAHCMDGFADCDGLAANGCETAVSDTACGCGGATQDCEALAGAGGDGACVGSGPGAVRCEARSCAGGFQPCGASCVDVDNNRQHCGSCFQDCGPDALRCSGGMCQCGPTANLCDGRCVPETDPNNCGGCGNVCSPGDTCDGFGCVPSCPPGLTDCPGFGCVDTNVDFIHCGMCGNTCVSGEECVGGDCLPECFLPNVRCGPVCTDPGTDPANCGACGVSCPMPGTGNVATSFCASGRCEIGCDAGFADCDADPTDCEADVSTDPANCGGCGIACGFGATCDAGRCDPVVKIVTSHTHTCALREGGTLACWGGNGSGQLAAASPATIPSPTAMPLVDVKDVALGDGFTCAVAFDGGSGMDRVFCWGDDSMSQLGDTGTRANPHVPQVVDFVAAGEAERVSAGADHACMTWRAGPMREVYCWGSGTFGASGSFTTRATPASVFPSSPPDDRLLSGRHFNCVLPESPIDGLRMECWGQNTSFQLGRSPATNDDVPGETATLPAENIDFHAFGEAHACGVFFGRLHCWGADDDSQTGIGSGATGTHLPTRTTTPGGRDAIELTMDDRATCVLLDDRSVWCRGDNPSGSLVPGGPATVTSWTRVTALGFQVKQLSDGVGDHRCALLLDGGVMCWGDNTNGEIGDGTTSASPRPPTRVVGY